MTLPEPGTAIAHGRYVLGAKLAEGGMSVVYEATEVGSGRPVAVKLLTERYKGRPEREQRLLDEGRYLDQIGRDPLIVEVLEHGRLPELDGWPYVVTELLKGCSLARLILRERALPLARLVELALQLARAIQLVHRRGVVHRDVTPTNVFVCEPPADRPGRGEQLKLFDFSHAGALERPRGRPRLTGAFDVPGTHGYMAPEQARAKPVTTAMDVFAFGAVLFELITRRPLFDVRDREQYIEQAKALALEVPQLQAWAYELPEALATLVNACTRLEADERPSLAEVVAALEVLHATLAEPQAPDPTPDPAADPASDPAPDPAPDPAEPRSPSPSSSSSASAEHQRRWPWLLGGVALVAVAGLAWSLRPSEPSEPAAHAFEPEPEPELAGPPAPTRPQADPPPGAPTPTPTPAPTPAPAPELDPPTKLASPTPPPTPKLASDHTTAACVEVREAVAAALGQRDWETVLDHAQRSRQCWADPRVPKRLRVEALAQTKAWTECVRAGGSSRDVEVQKWVEFCRIRAQR